MTKFLGIWEQLNNLDFKSVEFDGIRKQTGLNSFTLTPKQWKAQTKDTNFVDISNLRKSAQSVDKISSDNPQISQIRADFFGMNSYSSLQVVGDLICQT